MPVRIELQRIREPIWIPHHAAGRYADPISWINTESTLKNVWFQSLARTEVLSKADNRADSLRKRLELAGPRAFYVRFPLEYCQAQAGGHRCTEAPVFSHLVLAVHAAEHNAPVITNSLGFEILVTSLGSPKEILRPQF